VQQVDGDTSTNDTVIALASGLSGSTRIASIDSYEALQLQACLDVVSYAAIKLFTSLYKFIRIILLLIDKEPFSATLVLTFHCNASVSFPLALTKPCVYLHLI
jgi:hypothetical protein